MPLPSPPGGQGGTLCGPSKSVPRPEPWMMDGEMIYRIINLRTKGGVRPHAKGLCPTGLGPTMTLMRCGVPADPVGGGWEDIFYFFFSWPGRRDQPPRPRTWDLSPVRASRSRLPPVPAGPVVRLGGLVASSPYCRRRRRAPEVPPSASAESRAARRRGRPRGQPGPAKRRPPCARGAPSPWDPLLIPVG